MTELERRLNHLEERLEDYSAVQQTVQQLVTAVDKLAGEWASARRAQLVAALTIGGSAVLLAVTQVLQ